MEDQLHHNQHRGPGRSEGFTPAPRQRFTTDHGTHLLDRLNVVYRHRHVAISVFLLVVLAALLRAYTTTPLYRVQARLLIEVEDERTTAIVDSFNSGVSQYWQ